MLAFLLGAALILYPVLLIVRNTGSLKSDAILLSLLIFAIPGLVIAGAAYTWARRSYQLATQGELIDATITESAGRYVQRPKSSATDWTIKIEFTFTTPTGETIVRYEALARNELRDWTPPIGTLVKILYLNDSLYAVM
ncbi:MAG: DUF3592 domain-containing protein [Chloroflexota bacterium]